MDDHRLDALTTFLAARPSRRQVLRALTGLAGGGLAPLAVAESAGAFICRAGGVLCATGNQCWSDSCVDHHCTCADPSQVL